MDRRAVGRSSGLTLRMTLAFALLLCLYGGIVLLAYGVYLLWPAGWTYLLVAVVALVTVVAVHALKTAGVVVRVAGGRIVAPGECSELERRLDRLAALADVPTPRLAVVESETPNAFAAGFTQRRAVVAVTSSLPGALDEAELDAVLAHELSHIVNRDAAVMTAAAVPRFVGEYLVAGIDMGGPVVNYISLLWFLIWPVGLPVYALSALVMLTLSRYREFAADRGSAAITGEPEQLMSALRKLANAVAPETDLRLAGVQALCIVPVRPSRWTFLMDHPPLEQRLAALEQIAREMGLPVS